MATKKISTSKIAGGKRDPGKRQDVDRRAKGGTERRNPQEQTKTERHAGVAHTAGRQSTPVVVTGRCVVK
jgi:hypothetical protein